jgi:hypothetical protein
MFDKTKIFNLALAALFLQKRISNADTDQSTETQTLQTFWDTAYWSALQELDLDSTSSRKPLELVKDNPNTFWRYAYKYPSDCIFLRRIVSTNLTDDQESKIDLRVELFENQKCIMTNEQFAEVEYISKDVPLSTITAEAALFISLKLAKLSVPLIVGTNSAAVMKSIDESYVKAILDAQRKDSNETTIYQPEWMRSEFAKARMS